MVGDRALPPRDQRGQQQRLRRDAGRETPAVRRHRGETHRGAVCTVEAARDLCVTPWRPDAGDYAAAVAAVGAESVSSPGGRDRGGGGADVDAVVAAVGDGAALLPAALALVDHRDAPARARQDVRPAQTSRRCAAATRARRAATRRSRRGGAEFVAGDLLRDERAGLLSRLVPGCAARRWRRRRPARRAADAARGAAARAAWLPATGRGARPSRAGRARRDGRARARARRRRRRRGRARGRAPAHGVVCSGRRLNLQKAVKSARSVRRRNAAARSASSS